MFRSAVLKLTGWHVAALFLVCLLFSVPVYNIALTQLTRSAMQQTRLIQRYYDPETAATLALQRDRQLVKDRNELLTKFVMANLAILGAGALLSYEVARRTMKPIEASHRAQSRFTADASHELRTPLATMQTEIEVALRDASLKSSEAREVLQSNLEEIARLRGLSDELLALTRLDGKELKLSEIALSNIVSNEITKLKKRHGIAIESTVTKNIIAKGDEKLIRQLLAILIDNAVKYANGTPEITIKLSRADRKIRLTINDHGIGIKPEDINQVFDRFYRGSNASTKSGGHGLGLSLAKEIVDIHQGTITVSSTLGKETTFVIQLPTA